MKNTNDEYIAEIMAQKKELGIDCPAIDHIEIVEINGMKTHITVTKEETDMAQEETTFNNMDKVLKVAFDTDYKRILDMYNAMQEMVDDYYDCLNDQDHATPAMRRYIYKKSGEIKGMCKAFELLFHTRIEWGKDGIKYINTNTEEV